MKLIILAAGIGSRLKDLTKNNHKSLLSLNYKETILGRLINSYYLILLSFVSFDKVAI